MQKWHFTTVTVQKHSETSPRDRLYQNLQPEPDV
jgi:hypothetical protein